MISAPLRVVTIALCFSLASLAQAQPTLSPPATASVPRVMRVDGAFAPANGFPPAAVERVTLAIYASESGATPLWEETQEVRVDPHGRYAVFLGATSAEGLPLSLFAAGEPRWLGMRFVRPGEAERARVLLASVPYALRASDADTLGGLPPSAFLLADPAAREAGGGDAQTSPARAQPGPLVSSGTTNFIGKFTNAVDLGNSVLFENAGRIGLGTTTPLDHLHTRFTNTTGILTGLAVQNLGSTAASYSGMLFYDQNGALGQFQGFNNGTHEYRVNNIAAGGSINFMLGGSSKFLVGSNGDITIPSGSRIRNQNNVTLHTPPVFHTAVGEGALESWAGPGNGQGNTAVGYRALRSAVPSVSSGGPSNNVAVGAEALGNLVSGSNNVAVGYRALINASGGNGNIGLGAFAGAAQTTGSHNMYLGEAAGTGAGVAGESNTLRIGDQIWYDRTFIGGIRNRQTGLADALLVWIDSTGQVGTHNSSRRYKDDIQDMGDASSGLMKLRPVTYRYTQAYADGSRPIDYGLIAEDVEEVYADLVARRATGEVQTVQYQKVDAMLLNEVQKQHRKIGEQRTELAELRARLAALERLLTSDKK